MTGLQNFLRDETLEEFLQFFELFVRVNFFVQEAFIDGRESAAGLLHLRDGSGEEDVLVLPVAGGVGGCGDGAENVRSGEKLVLLFAELGNAFLDRFGGWLFCPRCKTLGQRKKPDGSYGRRFSVSLTWEHLGDDHVVFKLHLPLQAKEQESAVLSCSPRHLRVDYVSSRWGGKGRGLRDIGRKKVYLLLARYAAGDHAIRIQESSQAPGIRRLLVARTVLLLLHEEMEGCTLRWRL